MSFFKNLAKALGDEPQRPRQKDILDESRYTDAEWEKLPILFAWARNAQGLQACKESGIWGGGWMGRAFAIYGILTVVVPIIIKEGGVLQSDMIGSFPDESAENMKEAFGDFIKNSGYITVTKKGRSNFLEFTGDQSMPSITTKDWPKPIPMGWEGRA